MNGSLVDKMDKFQRKMLKEMKAIRRSLERIEVDVCEGAGGQGDYVVDYLGRIYDELRESNGKPRDGETG